MKKVSAKQFDKTSKKVLARGNFDKTLKKVFLISILIILVLSFGCTKTETGDAIKKLNKQSIPVQPVFGTGDETCSDPTSYVCGDVDLSGQVNVADLTYLVDYLLKSGQAPPLECAANADGKNGITIEDLTYLIDYLWKGGPEPTCDSNTECIENWYCNEWSECINGIQTRNCIDNNDCGTTNDKPTETQACEECTENWQCTAWSSCINGTQTRTCIDDNNCGTTNNIPALTQTCEVNAGFVVNHTNYNEFSFLTQEQLDRVRALDWLWGHQSVGRIMMYGLDDLEALDSAKYGINIVPISSEWQNFVTRQNYLDNSPMFGHIGMYEFWAFANANADLLDVAMMKYCYVNLDGGAHLTAASMFQEYKTNVNAFKLAHPEITLIHFTVPLTTGTDFYNSERSKYRDLILAEYGNEYVYDIADLESWHDGAYTTFNYLGTDYLRMNPDYTSDGGHPYYYGTDPFNEVLAKAWWVIMTKVAQDLDAKS